MDNDDYNNYPPNNWQGGRFSPVRKRRVAELDPSTVDNGYSQRRRVHDHPSFSPPPNNNNMMESAVNQTSPWEPAAVDQAHPDGVIRFPCRARGIRDNHDASTAFIEISPNAVHGTVLRCSHPVCAASGRLFRYCIQCQLPVAKRNFQKRHSHQGLHVGDTRTSLVAAGLSQEQREEEERRRIMYNQGITGGGMTRPQEMGDPRLATSSVAHAPDSYQQRLGSTYQEPAASQSQALPHQNGLHLNLTKKEINWLDLLRARPPTDDANSMSNWIDAVIAVSSRFHEPSMVSSDGVAARPQPEERENDDLSAKKPAANPYHNMKQDSESSLLYSGNRTRNLPTRRGEECLEPAEQKDNDATIRQPVNTARSQPGTVEPQPRGSPIGLSEGEPAYDGMVAFLAGGLSFDSHDKKPN